MTMPKARLLLAYATLVWLASARDISRAALEQLGDVIDLDERPGSVTEAQGRRRQLIKIQEGEKDTVPQDIQVGNGDQKEEEIAPSRSVKDQGDPSVVVQEGEDMEAQPPSPMDNSQHEMLVDKTPNDEPNIVDGRDTTPLKDAQRGQNDEHGEKVGPSVDTSRQQHGAPKPEMKEELAQMGRLVGEGSLDQKARPHTSVDESAAAEVARAGQSEDSGPEDGGTQKPELHVKHEKDGPGIAAEETLTQEEAPETGLKLSSGEITDELFSETFEDQEAGTAAATPQGTNIAVNPANGDDLAEEASTEKELSGDLYRQSERLGALDDSEEEIDGSTSGGGSPGPVGSSPESENSREHGAKHELEVQDAVKGSDDSQPTPGGGAYIAKDVNGTTREGINTAGVVEVATEEAIAAEDVDESATEEANTADTTVDADEIATEEINTAGITEGIDETATEETKSHEVDAMGDKQSEDFFMGRVDHQVEFEDESGRGNNDAVLHRNPGVALDQEEEFEGSPVDTEPDEVVADDAEIVPPGNEEFTANGYSRDCPSIFYFGGVWGLYNQEQRYADHTVLALLFQELERDPSEDKDSYLKSLLSSEMPHESTNTREPLAMAKDGELPDAVGVESNGNSSDPKSVNTVFVDGLDDIDKFFEGVDPPDELDVGAAGSSMQEVLMGQGTRIVIKRITMGFRVIRKGFVETRQAFADRRELILEKKELFLERKAILVEKKDELFSRLKSFFARFRNEDGFEVKLKKESFVAALRWAQRIARKALVSIRETVDDMFEGEDTVYDDELRDMEFRMKQSKESSRKSD